MQPEWTEPRGVGLKAIGEKGRGAEVTKTITTRMVLMVTVPQDHHTDDHDTRLKQLLHGGAGRVA
jgi:hypothetical protein